MLRWYRSWPRNYESVAHLPHVVDNLPRLLMSSYDYRSVEEWPDDAPGICLLEWDVALDQRGRMEFAGLALMSPYEILAAPYMLGSGWLPRDLNGESVEIGSDYCELFGMGCIYLPRKIVREFVDTGMTADFTDSTLARWYLNRHGRARCTWRVLPQHLHEWIE